MTCDCLNLFLTDDFPDRGILYYFLINMINMRLVTPLEVSEVLQDKIDELLCFLKNKFF